jgi:hypothetical protein
MAKDLEYFRTKLIAARNVIDETLKEMETEKPTTRKRQNKKEARILDFAAQYERKKRK